MRVSKTGLDAVKQTPYTRAITDGIKKANDIFLQSTQTPKYTLKGRYLDKSKAGLIISEELSSLIRLKDKKDAVNATIQSLRKRFQGIRGIDEYISSLVKAFGL